MSDAYDKIDRHLRNELDDEDYAECSKALDELYAVNQTMRDLLIVAEHMQFWIMSVPDDTPLPAMPGLCGEFIQATLQRSRKLLHG
jgi:hypothetical protein